MRLWHIDLIPVLPRKQLIAQWRECCSICSNIAKNGTPNHILVNKMLNYPSSHFIYYTNKILAEMHNRGYKVSEVSYNNFCKNMEKANEHFYNEGPFSLIIFPGWHNQRYLKQCFHNLQEKYDCEMFTYEEYGKLYLEYKRLLSKYDESKS